MTPFVPHFIMSPFLRFMAGVLLQMSYVDALCNCPASSRLSPLPNTWHERSYVLVFLVD